MQCRKQTEYCCCLHIMCCGPYAGVGDGIGNYRDTYLISIDFFC